MLLGRKRKQDTAAAAVIIRIQDKRNHDIVAVGEVQNHEFTIDDLLENSDVEKEYEGASNYEEDTDEKENELHPETDADFIQWQPSTSSCSKSHQLQSTNGGEEQNGHVRKW